MSFRHQHVWKVTSLFNVDQIIKKKPRMLESQTFAKPTYFCEVILNSGVGLRIKDDKLLKQKGECFSLSWLLANVCDSHNHEVICVFIQHSLFDKRRRPFEGD